MSKVRIGAGNKTFDKIYLYGQCIALLILLLVALYNPMAIIFSIFFSTFVAIELVKIAGLNYVFFCEGNFVIEHIFRQSKIIHVRLYQDISKLQSAMLFSNELVIHFKNGEKYKFRGGINKISDVKANVDFLVKRAQEAQAS